jgi:hypothetical protein
MMAPAVGSEGADRAHLMGTSQREASPTVAITPLEKLPHVRGGVERAARTQAGRAAVMVLRGRLWATMPSVHGHRGADYVGRLAPDGWAGTNNVVNGYRALLLPKMLKAEKRPARRMTPAPE